MKNEAFQILLDAGIVTEDKLMTALHGGNTLTISGPWEGSDYSGSDWQESNHRSLARDYKSLLICHDSAYGHCEYWLEIDPREFGKGSVRDEAKGLAEVLAGLVHEYPIYDEDDNYRLIEERAEAAWNQYLRSDLSSKIWKLTEADISLDDMHDKFRELLGEHEIWPEAEGHRDVSFPGINDPEFQRDLILAALRNGGLDTDDMSDLTHLGYELVGTWMAEDYAWVHPDQMALDLAGV
ncbi:hypothetical protein ACTMTF_15255 [Nonomuraea sp. ZG12]|uniref:hypothetical protein n=1 Tax=Nonomuraea sp. ZG12 TaxID=3452207 RepID=UPI003F8BEA2B